LTIVAGAAATFVLLYLWHRGMAPAQPRPHVNTADTALETVFSAGLLPQADFLLRQILYAPHVAAMVAAAPFLWRRRFESTPARLAMPGFWLPILTVLFYRNSYPYFFVFLLAPVLIAAIPAIELAVKRFGEAFYCAILLCFAFTLWLMEPKQMLSEQRSVIDGVHQIFPEPVAYLDFCGMIGDFPRPLQILTSGWGLGLYREGREPSFEWLMQQRPIPMLLVNHGVLLSALDGQRRFETLLSADARLLRDNYIPHWGPVWVAGKRLPKAARAYRIRVAIPGTYTLEGAPVLVDSKPLAPGEQIRLARGEYMVTPDIYRDAKLRWGTNLARPARPAPQDYLFSDY
jgi:hypothetical protein